MGDGNRASFTLKEKNTYTGTTVIKSGTLCVQGSIITPVILDGGAFGGTVTVIKDPSVASSTGDVTVNGGFLLPGADQPFGKMTIEGDLTFNGSLGTLQSDLFSVGDLNFTQVNGIAALDGTLKVEKISGNFLEGQVLVLLRAEGNSPLPLSQEELDQSFGILGTFSFLDLLPRFQVQ